MKYEHDEVYKANFTFLLSHSDTQFILGLLKWYKKSIQRYYQTVYLKIAIFQSNDKKFWKTLAPNQYEILHARNCKRRIFPSHPKINFDHFLNLGVKYFLNCFLQFGSFFKFKQFFPRSFFVNFVCSWFLDATVFSVPCSYSLWVHAYDVLNNASI